jgi:uncharacterized protein YdhG (YjbR/CyaY superfamily)
MKAGRKAARDIDEYIAGFPEDVRKVLQKIRIAIKKAAPDAEEAIKYQIPTFTLNGNLVHFAAFTHHVGFYPAPRGKNAFKKELAGYEGGKGTVRFPLDKPVPFDLITTIVKFRVKENLQKPAARRKAP